METQTNKKQRKTYKRTQKFSDKERKALIESVRDRSDILENDKKDFKSNSRRIEEWEYVARDFNEAFPNNNRTVQQLKMLWKRAKISALKEATNIRKNVKKTGGGAAEGAVTLSAEAELVLGAIGDKADPMSNSFDDDATQNNRHTIAKLNSSLSSYENDVDASGKFSANIDTEISALLT